MNQHKTATAGIAAFALMLIASSSQAAGVNLVANGSFEKMTNGVGQIGSWGVTQVTDWTATGPGYMTVFASGTATTGVPNGGQPLTLWGPGNGAANGLPASSPDGGNFIATDATYGYNNADVTPLLSQTVNGLTVGDQYSVSFYYAGAEWYDYSSPHNLTNAWRVSLGAETKQTPILSYASHGFSGWQQATMTFTASSASEVLSFLATDAPSGVPPIALLDGVSMTDVTPTPLPAALFFVAPALAGVFGFSRRKHSKA